MANAAPSGEPEVQAPGETDHLALVALATPDEAPQAPVPAEPAPAAAPAPAAKKRTRKARGTKAKAPQSSAIDAAARVLKEAGKAMNCQELIGVMAAKGYWTSPGGKTRAATLYSAILRELQVKGDDAHFVKSGRGMFAIRTRP